MYLIVMIITLAIFSSMAMIFAIKTIKDKNKVVFIGMMTSILAILGIFAILSYTENPISEIISLKIKESVDLILNNDNFLKLFNLENATKAAAKNSLLEIYKLMAVLLPSMIIMLSAIVSVLVYKAIWSIRFKGKDKEIENFYIKEYSLTRKTLLMWILMTAVAYVGVSEGNRDFAVVMMNLEVVIRNMLKLEGVLTIVHLGRLKNRSTLAMFIFAIAILLIPYGEGILIGAGLYSSLYAIRQKNKISSLKKR